MCTELSSQITRLTSENDLARSLAVCVRPDSSLQQAPWWVKNPKQYTWLNLPDGVNDDQRDKDLTRMGISPHPRRQKQSTIGLRTPSPEDGHRKRKRKHHHDRDDRKRSRREFYPYLDQREEEYIHPPQIEDEISVGQWTNPWSTLPRTDQRYDNGSSTAMLSSLLDVVQEDMRYYTGAPPPPPPPPVNRLSLQDSSMPFKQHPLQAGKRFTYHAPLLPRPSMMSPEQFAETFYPQSSRRPSIPQPPPQPPPLLPLPRLMSAQHIPLEQSGLSLLSTESAGRIPESTRSTGAEIGVPSLQGSPPVISFREPAYNDPVAHPTEPSRERHNLFPPHGPGITPPKESSQTSQPVPPAREQRQGEPPLQLAPMLIAPRPISAPPPLPSPPVEPPKPTPIQPSPATKSRSGSHSPEAHRMKRPLTLLPKALRPQSPPAPPPQVPSPEERTKNPLLRFGERPPTLSSIPPPPASMGRFGNIDLTSARFSQYSPNPKIAIARHPSQIRENPAPLRIAPAPAKKVDSSVYKNDEGGRGFVEIRRKSSGDQSTTMEDNSGQKRVEEEDGKKGNGGKPKKS